MHKATDTYLHKTNRFNEKLPTDLGKKPLCQGISIGSRSLSGKRSRANPIEPSFERRYITKKYKELKNRIRLFEKVL
ncbi:hypothetical protein CH371_07400 [Leptospira wolffii]|uniref:Uncharacterized protein n=1 Tax=Leptospira wolffii TaxID=409998 RepID=A0A2M9ZHJ6_9LEPT|nr:hypothetical protein CH371_07400 [Leptospira wolffii]